MNYKKIILYILIQYLLIGVLKAQELSFADTGLIGKILTEKYQLFYSKTAIDKRLVKLLKQKENFNLELANPEQEYNQTDMIIRGLPNKRLIMVAKNTTEISFILYENGGNAPYNVCLMYRQINGKYNIKSIRLNGNINTLEELKTAITHKDFEILK